MEEKIVKIKMKGEEREFFLVPSFRNLKRMQARLNGERFFATANRLIRMDYGPSDIVDIMYSLIDQDEKVKYDDFSEGVMKQGFNTFTKTITQLFTEIIQQGQEESEEGDGEEKN